MQSGEQWTRADAVLEQRRNKIGGRETYLHTSAIQGAALQVRGARERRLYALLATTAQRNSAALRPAVDWAECEASSSLEDVRRASPQRRRAKVGGFMHQRALSARRGAFLSTTALAGAILFAVLAAAPARADGGAGGASVGIAGGQAGPASPATRAATAAAWAATARAATVVVAPRGGTGGNGGGGGAAGGAGGGTSGSPNGGAGFPGVIGGGGGGGGGFNFNGAGSATISNTSLLTSGNGGQGGDVIGGPGGGGGGGAGGYGAIVIGGGASSNTGAIAGGTGGAGGRGILGTGGNGGDGGVGVQFTTTGATFTNSGTVAGGNGGVGGTGVLGGGNGGDGGVGVLFTTTGATFTNSGTVARGNGGVGGTGIGATNGTAGDGGVGIVGSGLTIINSGTITGGLSGDGVTRANAITFTGGANTLELQAGSSITGNVVAFSTADTFRLGGTTNASFDVSQIGPSAQYQGFGVFQKTGTSTRTLTGTTSTVTSWTINGGTLQAGATNVLGSSSAITVASGAVLNLASFNQAIGSLAGAGSVTQPRRRSPARCPAPAD